MNDVNIEQMADDIMGQQSNIDEEKYPKEKRQPKKESSLLDIEPYNMTDEFEDDFDIVYRTPPQVSENERLTLKDMKGTKAFPQNYIVTEDIDDAFKEIEKTHPLRNRKVFLPGIYNRPKNILKTIPQKSKPFGIYSVTLDEIFVTPPKSENWEDMQSFWRTLEHEDTHQRQRRMELNTPINRIFNEPSVPLFNKMFKEYQIMNDFQNKLKKESVPFEERNEILKNRKDVINEFKKESFAEQLAYYGDYFSHDAYSNPRTKTERVYNRLKFKNAPIWG